MAGPRSRRLSGLAGTGAPGSSVSAKRGEFVCFPSSFKFSFPVFFPKTSVGREVTSGTGTEIKWFRNNWTISLVTQMHSLAGKILLFRDVDAVLGGDLKIFFKWQNPLLAKTRNGLSHLLLVGVEKVQPSQRMV